MKSLQKHGVILASRDLAFEEEGVLNPAVIYEDGVIHMFYRAVAAGNQSSIGYCRLDHPLEVSHRNMQPVFVPTMPYERHGVEDPRIVKIDGKYLLSYCAYDGQNALGCVAISEDMKHFEKLGIQVPVMSGDELRHLLKGKTNLNIKYFQPNTGSHIVWDKNLVFFPRRINKKLHFLHRIRPGIQIVAVDELSDLNPAFWEDYMRKFEDHIVLDPKFAHELSYIGNGCPPIETDQGWLLIYHGVHDTVNGYMYVACAALLDLENPQKELARLPFPLFVPDQDYELQGYVNYVCFPTGAVVLGDTLYIYYGAADQRIACASLSIGELIQELLRHRTEPS